MQNTTKALIAELEREFGAYQCWHVPIVVGPDAWCARRWDGRGKVINAYSPEALQADIEAEIESLAGEPEFGTPVKQVPPDGPGVRRVPPDQP